MKRILKSYCRRAVRYTAMLVLVLIYVSSAQAQHRTYLDNQNDHIYTSVATILSGDQPSTGYVIASTVIDANGLRMGEVVRTDSNGGPLWTKLYIPSNGEQLRVNHIEKCRYMGALAYLVVGSVITSPTSERVFAMLIDDNGAVLRSKSFPAAKPFFMGAKGIMFSNGSFAIAGILSNDLTFNSPNEIAIIKLDAGFNFAGYFAYSTPSPGRRDYDGITSLIECPDPSHLVIVGTSNRWDSAALGPAAMASKVNLLTGAVDWSYNFSSFPDSLKHWDAGVDAVWAPQTSSIWILSNSARQHTFSLTELDAATGALLSPVQFSTYPNDQYGFKLMPARGNPNNLVIAGMRDSAMTHAIPFLVEFAPSTNTVQWHREYFPGRSNNLYAYNENNWLRMLSQGQFGMFYNTIASYRVLPFGYAMVGSDSVISNLENVRLWPKITQLGNTGCGKTAFTYSVTDSLRITYPPLEWIAAGINHNDYPVNNPAKGYNTDDCNLTAKKGEEAMQAYTEAAVSGVKLYPNPANNSLNLEYLFATGTQREVTIYDMTGRKMYNQMLTEIEGIRPLNTATWPAGLYMVNVTENGQRIFNSRVVITRE